MNYLFDTDAAFAAYGDQAIEGTPHLVYVSETPDNIRNAKFED